MPLNMDAEILQDFLVEAGEILETLSEQLVELEARANDAELLNAIFRGFHTVKGGAGFLSISHLVEICHIAENVFDMLRKGQRQVDSALMDVILKTLDEVNRMMQELRADTYPEPAPAEIIQALQDLIQPASAPAKPPAAAPAEPAPKHEEPASSPAPSIAPPAAPTEVTASPDHAPLGQSTEQAPPTLSEDITEEEFERLLDVLQGVPVTPDKAAATASQTAHEVPHEAAGAPSTPMPESPKTPAPKKDEPSETKAPAAAKEAQETTVRVDTARLDEIMNMVGELVLVRNRLLKIKDHIHEEELGKAVANLDLVTADLQMSVMKTRMQPIKKVFGRFPRVVRDLARSLNKEINLVLQGEETDLDKNLVEALSDPLVHLVRNAVDHGIEMPAERLAQNKKATGKVVLSAQQAGDHILLSIQDDGRGMDPEVLRRKAVEKGVMEPEVAERLSVKECFEIILLPGFSTKDQITDISGRGVGMDVVKTKITQLNGVVDISSKFGEGTLITIKVPLTLAILPTLMVIVAQQVYALPLTSVDEIFQLDMEKTNVVDGQRVVVVRDKPVPLFNLRDWLYQSQNLSLAAASPKSGNHLEHVVIVSIGTQRIAFVVDGLIGQEEVVIKALGSMLLGTPGMAGATITGDGKIAMILDINGLLQQYAKSHVA